MSKVVRLPINTKLPLPIDVVLDGALDHELTEVVVLGREPDGKLYIGLSDADIGLAIMLMEWAKMQLVRELD